jgi:hypothetical protein
MNATRERRRNTRSSARLASGLNVVAGIWLLAAPFVLGYSHIGQALWNDLLVGAALVITALIRATTPRRSASLGWVNMLLGAWLIIAPFVLLYTGAEPLASPGAATANDVVVGVIVVALATWSLKASRGVVSDAEASLDRISTSTSERGGPSV